MSKYLTVIFNNEPYVSSLLLSEKLNFEHKYIRKILKKYKDHFLELGSFLGEVDDENMLENDNDLRETDSLKSTLKRLKRGRQFKTC